MGDERLRVFNVVPSLPEKLRPLAAIAKNLWFTWHPEAVSLFHRLDRKLYAKTRHNPVAMLGAISQERLEQVLEDEGFLAQMHRVHDLLETYLASTKQYDHNIEAPLPSTVVYISTEFGLADCLPVYSGGLGILSGDHLKSASDLNLPLVGIGLAYQHGYFSQYLNADGWQQERNPANDFHNMPVELLRDGEDRALTLRLDMEGRPLLAHVWKVRVGRVPLYMLDTNLRENPEAFREITAQLYGGDRETRLRQEYVLGLGAVALVEALDLQPGAYHLNEGHSAFALLERIRRFMVQDGLSFDEARELVVATTVFTTHTPVPAGNEVFDPRLVARYFGDMASDLGITVPYLLGLGRKDPSDESEPFGMTVFALKLSAYANGVAKLHADVARRMWVDVWHDIHERDVPIRAVTNGIHTPSWISAEMATLFDRYLGPRWHEDPDNDRVWARVDDIPDSELWRTHERRRERLVSFVRSSLSASLRKRGASTRAIEEAGEVLNPEALTIGFARRFATYKRGNLFMSDPERFARLLKNPERPVQLIVAGKAHPKDDTAKELIRNIVQYMRDYELRQHIVFLEDYDINVGRYMVQGCDVWLNTPRRPHEACGTSGMKAVANGCLHMSVLDGWWDEAYRGDNGFAIGLGEEYEDEAHQDKVESATLYKLLEDRVVPLFYDRSKGFLPREWIQMMKRSMGEHALVFNTHRMLEEYTQQAYGPATRNWDRLRADGFAGARELAAWRHDLAEAWDEIEVLSLRSDGGKTLGVGQHLSVEARIDLGSLTPSDLAVDLYYGPMNSSGELERADTIRMTLIEPAEKGPCLFRGEIPAARTGRFGYKLRLVPRHPLLARPESLDTILWA